MKIIVVGGGCSGVTAAIKAKNSTNEVTIIERNNSLLKKLLLTGNGRCNYFNEVYNSKYYHSTSNNLIDSLISDKNISLAKEFLDNLGIIPNIKNGYYYPYSNQAINIKEILENELKRLNVNIIYDTYVEDIEKDNNVFNIYTNNGKFSCDKIILATGGMSYPKTGSDGKGYSILEKLNHTLIKPTPALVQLTSDDSFLKEWDGVRSNVYVELFENNKFIASEEGEIQLTKYGVSGICIFNLSHYVGRGLLSNNEYLIKINFVPFIETLITPWMDKYSKLNQNKDLYELLEGFLNKKIIKIVLKQANLSSTKKYHELTNDEKLILCKKLRSFRVNITGTKGFENAQVCNGGIKLDEINLKTMESNIIKGLYITGELLDITGNCGGYNLTECWITGLLAGKSIGDNHD